MKTYELEIRMLVYLDAESAKAATARMCRRIDDGEAFVARTHGAVVGKPVEVGVHANR